MNNVFVWMASWDEKFDSQKEPLIHTLPIHLQKEILKFKYSADQNQALMSKLLVNRMLKMWGYDFTDLHYIQNQKPYIHHPDTPPFFSYSKSIGKVVLVWSWEIDVGIDIEYLHRNTDWKIFQSRLSSSVWNQIIHDENPSFCFIWSWTHIEAIIKLKAIGLADHIKLVEYKEKQWYFENEKIYTQCIIHENHVITLASHEPFHFEIEKVSFEV
ncbi:MAG: hypothetical protein KatS3mg035_0474 [Bacteroidia bacterium]|jgi:phosphopantetheinyl transferase|nr:MAG: hypothetical protein KatS3mg035_0474 [Bacteroidia bacterium]